MSTRQTLRGFRSIEECFKKNPKSIHSITVTGPLSHRERQFIENVRSSGILVRDQVQRSRDGGAPRSAQSLEAQINGFEYADIHAILENLSKRIAAQEQPVVLALDGITDPQNLGALIRTAAFMGISAVVLPQDRSATINDTVLRIAAGGAEHVPVVQVVNLANIIDQFKENGFWIVGFSEAGAKSMKTAARDFPMVLVIGSEEKGIRSLTEKKCDHLLRIEATTEFTTLNASVAGALAMAWATHHL